MKPEKVAALAAEASARFERFEHDTADQPYVAPPRLSIVRQLCFRPFQFPLYERHRLERVLRDSSFRKEATSCSAASVSSRDIAATTPGTDRCSTAEVLDDVLDQITSPVFKFFSAAEIPTSTDTDGPLSSSSR